MRILLILFQNSFGEIRYGGIFVGAGVKIGIGIGIGTEKVPLMKGFFSEKELPAKEHKFFALKEFSKKKQLLTEDLAQEQTLQ